MSTWRVIICLDFESDRQGRRPTSLRCLPRNIFHFPGCRLLRCEDAELWADENPVI
jgi:hypothetical protein